VLTGEWNTARTKGTEAQRQMHAAAVAVLAIEAERIAQHHAALLAEAERCISALVAFDRSAGTSWGPGIEGSLDDLVGIAR
jgi:hypothetical protein